MLKIIKRIVTSSVAILVVAFIIIKLAWSQPYEPALETDLNIKFNSTKIHDDSLHYAYSGNIESNVGIIFIHGTPGGWAAFERYLISPKLQKDFLMVAVDRPGWGQSVTKNQKLNGIFSHQAQTISSVFEDFPHKKWIVLGHSLGASLAPQLAIESPQTVNGLILLAGSLNPKLGNPRWYNYAARTWVISKMVGKVMTESNREIMKLRKQLKLMTAQIDKQSFPVDVIVIQGLKDKLVSPKNPQYVDEQWRDNFNSIEIVELPEAGHFIPWENANTVASAIYAMAIKITQKDIKQ